MWAKPIVESKFHGLNDNTPPEELGPGFFTKIDNAFCSDGKVTKSTGSTAINTAIASHAFNGFTAFEILSSNSKFIVANVDGASNAQLYQSTGGNFSAIGSANLTNGAPMWFESAANKLFGFNGSEEVDWDGTTVTKNRSGLPKGYYAKWFHNYLFVAKDTSNLNRLYWSSLGDPTAFSTSTDFVDINPGDSDQIMGLAGIQDELLVFKKNTIWSITGFSGTTFTSTTAATQNTNARIFGYGTVAPFSIVPIGNDVFFFSQLGSTPVIRSLYKTINSVTLGGGVISNNIKTTLDSITLSALGKIVGTFDGRYVYWAIPTNGSSSPNKIITLDTWEITGTKTNATYPFTTLTGKNASYFAASTIPGHTNIYFSDASTTSGLVFKFDSSVYTDNGTNVTMDVRTRDYFHEPSRKSKWKYLYTTYTAGNSASIKIGATIDQGTGYTNQATISTQGNSPGLGMFTLGSSTLGGAGTSTQRTTFAGITCHYLGLQFLESTANSVTIHHWDLHGKPRGLRAK